MAQQSHTESHYTIIASLERYLRVEYKKMWNVSEKNFHPQKPLFDVSKCPQECFIPQFSKLGTTGKNDLQSGFLSTFPTLKLKRWMENNIMIQVRSQLSIFGGFWFPKSSTK